MTKDELIYAQKELNRASNFGIIGLVGAVIPILGTVFGLVALFTAISIEPSNSQIRSKRFIAISVAAFAILLSIVAGVAYFKYYRHILDMSQCRERMQREHSSEDSNRVWTNRGYVSWDQYVQESCN